jgi:hypothetical protein
VVQPSSIQLAISIATDGSVLLLYDESGGKQYHRDGTLMLDIPDVNRYEKGGPLTNYSDYGNTLVFYDLDEIYDQAWLMPRYTCSSTISGTTRGASF